MDDGGYLVVMVLDDLADAPAAAVPGGVRLRPYIDGDAATWASIQEGADDAESFHPERFTAEFADDADALARRQIYATDEELGDVGTVTAWTAEDAVAPDYGRLHWLAVLPEARRRGIGSALVAAALQRLRALGHGGVYLTTSPARPDALRLYERFGFREVPVEVFYASRGTRLL